MRVKSFLMIVVSFFLFTAASVAQVSLASLPVQVMDCEGGQVGLIQITSTAAGTGKAGDTFEISFGVPITNTTASGITMTSTWTGGATFMVVNSTSGTITITVGGTTDAAGETIILSGVQVLPLGLDGPLNATVTSATIGITPQQTATVVLDVSGSCTFLFLPLVTVNAVFDTGISISNSSGLPILGSLNQGGTITFHFFPTAEQTTPTDPIAPGPSFTFTTAPLLAGAVFTASASEMLADVGVSPPFQGSALAVAKFGQAHGTSVVFDSSGGFTHSYLALVITGPRPSVNESLGH
ncbi:hypothetical protein MYX82_10065 [Acidobacteria bacterium AH-259-D05]|nr:hypothetical protein [Acidobacteria bacterium AH-259-D05]